MNKTLSEQIKKSEHFDSSVPGKKLLKGHLHPITQIRRKIENIFFSMGFDIVQGPEIETQYYNFDALNISDTHPARDEWDTFYLRDNRILRTHTSPVQIRYMEKNNPPFRIISPGRCFRNERTDNTHDIVFQQIEGLLVDKKVSVGNFKAVLGEFLKRLFNEKTQIRLRPGFFPFTEPSFEIDVKLKNKWLEIMGAGMVHPKVFQAVGYVPGDWQGFAFGLGLERVAMIKWGIDDIRLFHSNDLRFLNQF